MPRDSIPTWFFVLVVVRKGDKFLLVHELKHGERWYLPAGRIEPREDFMSAAIRETLEESSIPIELQGILQIQHTPMFDGSARVRFIVVARPVDDTPPKSEADKESLGAAWMTIEEMKQVPLRGDEAVKLCQAVAADAPLYPLNLISCEAPLRFG